MMVMTQTMIQYLMNTEEYEEYGVLETLITTMDINAIAMLRMMLTVTTSKTNVMLGIVLKVTIGAMTIGVTMTEAGLFEGHGSERFG